MPRQSLRFPDPAACIWGRAARRSCSSWGLSGEPHLLPRLPPEAWWRLSRSSYTLSGRTAYGIHVEIGDGPTGGQSRLGHGGSLRLLLITALGISVALMLATGAVHYEVLRTISTIRGRVQISHRTELLLYITAALFAHLVCVSLYALAYAWMHDHPHLGALQGKLDAAASDFLYFSFACYTTLGFGDIYPVGAIRIVAGIEALNGLLLIAWSAAFTVYRLERLWRDEP